MQRCYGCMKEYGRQFDVCPHCGYIAGTEPESKSHLKPGTVLAGKYLLGRAIGHGGFGITYIAWEKVIQKTVAIKEFFPNAFSTRSEGETSVSCYNKKSEGFFREGVRKMLDEAKRLSRFSSNENVVDKDEPIEKYSWITFKEEGLKYPITFRVIEDALWLCFEVEEGKIGWYKTAA